MKYDKIREIIESDYNNVLQSRKVGGRSNGRAFYLTFSKALYELHLSVGPFITSKEQFIERIKYLESQLPKDVYEAMLDYCKNKLDIKF